MFLDCRRKPQKTCKHHTERMRVTFIHIDYYSEELLLVPIFYFNATQHISVILV